METDIEWTATVHPVTGELLKGFSLNEWWGCEKVILSNGLPDPACVNCYAHDQARRYGFKIWGATAPRRAISEKTLNQCFKWNAEAEASGIRRKVFAFSMGDVFEDRRDLDELRTKFFERVERCPWLDWLILTKRPQHVMDMVPESWREKFPDNVWIGTSIVNQAAFDERWPYMRSIPARIRFLSMEPLNEHVDITPALSSGLLHWVIGGGESGTKARPSHPNWFRWQAKACAKYGVPYFLKQWGEWAPVMDETKFLLGAGETDANAHMFVNPDGSTGSVWIMDSDGNLSNWTTNYSEEHSCLMSRVGKKHAGALLDGREYKAWPE